MHEVRRASLKGWHAPQMYNMVIDRTWLRKKSRAHTKQNVESSTPQAKRNVLSHSTTSTSHAYSYHMCRYLDDMSFSCSPSSMAECAVFLPLRRNHFPYPRIPRHRILLCGDEICCRPSTPSKNQGLITRIRHVPEVPTCYVVCVLLTHASFELSKALFVLFGSTSTLKQLQQGLLFVIKTLTYAMMQVARSQL